MVVLLIIYLQNKVINYNSNKNDWSKSSIEENAKTVHCGAWWGMKCECMPRSIMLPLST